MERILLTEDNPDNADLVCALLDFRYQVEVVRSAAEALAWLDARDAGSYPGLFLLDISLPGMDGSELLRRLRADARYAKIPAVALTAHAMKDDRNRLLAVGFDEYLSKPVDADQLLGVVEQLLAPDP